MMSAPIKRSIRPLAATANSTTIIVTAVVMRTLCDIDAVDDEKAEAALRGEHLADQHAQEGHGKSDAQAGDDLRQHGRRSTRSAVCVRLRRSARAVRR